MKKLIASSSGMLLCLTKDGESRFPCAIGKGGMVAADQKREGDGASPIGRWPLRTVYYRPDRIARVETRLPIIALTETDGWCDAPDDPAYNRRITRPYAASHEVLWREDHVYDLIVELGHNDSPPVPGLGSAIFIHVARPDYAPTEGCIALALPDLQTVLKLAGPETVLEIRA